MSARFAPAAVFLLALGAPALAGPPAARDEALRLAPPDAALVVVVQNLRDHLAAVKGSPFGAWFPTSPLGKQLLGTPGLKGFADGAGAVLGAVGLTPAELTDDILGDAAVFAYTPAAAGDPASERSLIVLRPRKPELLGGAVERLNDIQKKNGELKGVAERAHAGAAYFERQKPNGPPDFYAFRDGAFVFSQSEAEVRAALARAGASKEKAPELAARMTKLGVGDAFAVVLVNPRPLDSELAAKVKAAPADERAFLARFAEVWAATDAAAAYLALGKDVEVGVSLHFTPEKLPAELKGWLVGARSPSALWASVPAEALFATGGRVKPNDVLDVLARLGPGGAGPSPRAAVEQALGPVFGKGRLPAVLETLGPDWAAWALPPGKGGAVPAAVAAVRLDGPNAADAAKALTRALEFGLQSARVAYNARHTDQLELTDEKDGDATLTVLSGPALPRGFAPCFAVKGGYLVLSTSPDAVRAFQPPTGKPKPASEVPLVRFHARGVREYLAADAAALAKVLSDAGAGDAKSLAEQLGALALALEPLDAVDLLVRGDETGLKLVLRAKPVKPLRK